VDGVGEVPQAGAGRGGVPVDERPLAVADDEVPGSQVVVGDDLVAVSRDERLPAGVRRRGEPGDGTVEVADEAGGAAESGVIVQQVELIGPGGCARG
jgi:hypothetical protein